MRSADLVLLVRCLHCGHKNILTEREYPDPSGVKLSAPAERVPSNQPQAELGYESSSSRNSIDAGLESMAASCASSSELVSHRS